MIEFGKTLRLAREAKGYTISQIAEMTRMIHQVVEDLENENFSRIAAPIYGRGFVKLYCEAVGIDSKALVDEFMAIYNGQRELGIKEREIKPSPSAPLPEGPKELAPGDETVEAPPVRTAIGTAVPKVEAAPPFSPPPTPDAVGGNLPTTQESTPAEGGASRFARYASPLREMNMPSFSIPPAAWRIASLAVVALIILYLLFAGLKALYNATTSSGENPAGAETAEAAAETAESAANQNRTPAKVDPLYID